MNQRRLLYFKMIDGVRTPVTLVLDDTLLMIAEKVGNGAEAEQREIPTTGGVVVGAIDGASLQATGVADASVKVGTLLALWTTPEVAENPIEGTDELREEYLGKLRDMRAKAVSEGVACRSCDVGKLMRRYRAKLEEGGFV